MARVSALLRRHERAAEQAQPAATLRASQLLLDRDRRQAVVRGALVDLTKQEFDLLYLLAARPDVVFSRAALLQQVWRDDTYVTERTVDTVISRLRRKIESCRPPRRSRPRTALRSRSRPRAPTSWTSA